MTSSIPLTFDFTATADPALQIKARECVANLLSTTAITHLPDFVFLKNHENPARHLEKNLRDMEGLLQDNPEILDFMEKFTALYARALKNDKTRNTQENKDLGKRLTGLSAYLHHLGKDIKDRTTIKQEEEYDEILDALIHQAALGRLGPFNTIAQQISHWAEHSWQDIKSGIGIGKSWKQKLWRIPLATSLTGSVLGATIMMYANFEPPTTITINPVSTAYTTPIIDENGMLSIESAYDPNAIVDNLKIGCHGHIEKATFGNKTIADYAVKHVFKDPKAYEHCIVVGKASQDYYARLDAYPKATKTTMSKIFPQPEFTKFKRAFNSSVDKTHEFWKGFNNIENAVVHPLITQIHAASSFSLFFFGIRNLFNRASKTAGHLYAHKLRYSFMAAASTAAWMHTGEMSLGGILTTIPNMIMYSVGALLAGDAAQWTWRKIKRPDLTKDLQKDNIIAELFDFSDTEPAAHQTSWARHLTPYKIGVGTAALTAADALINGGQCTGFILGAVASSVVDVPYVFIEDIPMHVPFAVTGDVIGMTAAAAAWGGYGAYHLGKKISPANNTKHIPNPL